MTDDVRTRIRVFVSELFDEHDDHSGFDDTESLVESGRLDSLAVVRMVTFLETAFGVDFAQVEFDPQRFDSVAEIEAMVVESAQIG